MDWMKCQECKFAKWDRTASGRLHPSGDGRCTFEYILPPIPSCMYWIGSGPSKPAGGYISRHDGLREPCPVFQRLEADDNAREIERIKEEQKR